MKTYELNPSVILFIDSCHGFKTAFMFDHKNSRDIFFNESRSRKFQGYSNKEIVGIAKQYLKNRGK